MRLPGREQVQADARHETTTPVTLGVFEHETQNLQELLLFKDNGSLLRVDLRDPQCTSCFRI